MKKPQNRMSQPENRATAPETAVERPPEGKSGPACPYCGGRGHPVEGNHRNARYRLCPKFGKRFTTLEIIKRAEESERKS